jgi:hypothetical protein
MTTLAVKSSVQNIFGSCCSSGRLWPLPANVAMAAILLPLQLLLRVQSHQQLMLLIWSPAMRHRRPILPWRPLFNYCKLTFPMFGLQQHFCFQATYGVEPPVNMALAATFSLWSSFYKRGPKQHFCLSSRLLGGATGHCGHSGRFTFLEPLLSRVPHL